MPLLVLVPFVGLALLLAADGSSARQIARLLGAALELGLPLAAGFAAAMIAARDAAIELQLSTRTRYRTTLLRRLLLLTLWTGSIAFGAAGIFAAIGLWAGPHPFLLGQLAWLAPLLWFVAAGALVARFSGSGALGGVVVGVVWVLQNAPWGVLLFLSHGWLRPFFLFATTHAADEDFWLANRLTVATTALALGLALSLVLRNTDRFLDGGDA
jgi:hypothetical protein